MLDLIPQPLTRNFEIETNRALLVVSCLLGVKFDLKKLKKRWQQFIMYICHRSLMNSTAGNHWPIVFILPSTDRFPTGMHSNPEFSPYLSRCASRTQSEQPLM
ncbi:MAG: hypothetical protein ACI8R9_001561 [Paraglaciecola sp.]|jgi:hypothetical protein